MLYYKMGKEKKKGEKRKRAESTDKNFRTWCKNKKITEKEKGIDLIKGHGEEKQVKKKKKSNECPRMMGDLFHQHKGGHELVNDRGRRMTEPLYIRIRLLSHSRYCVSSHTYTVKFMLIVCKLTSR